MRIFCAMHDYDWEFNNLVAGLQQCGHETVVYGWPEFKRPKRWRWLMNRRLIARVVAAHRRQPLDLFFGYLSGKTVSVPCIETIRAHTGLPMLNFTCNDATAFEKTSRAIASHFDYYWASDANHLTLPEYAKMGVAVITLPLAVNHVLYRKLPDCPKQYDVTWIGSRVYNRTEYIEYLTANGINVFQGFKDGKKRPVSTEEMVRIYNASRIVLSFTNAGPVQQIRLRNFEAPMCGSFTLSEQAPGLEKLFVPDAEMVTFSDKHDLLAKVRHYLAREQERERIAATGYARALRSHTWFVRFPQLFDELARRGFSGVNNAPRR